MLQHLEIDNYALIRHLEMDFQSGFSVITGETGAGKSILLGALALILGRRAETQVLFNKSAKCIVEGSFRIRDYDLNDFFNNNQLDYDDLTILRREILPGGKSRAFINDTPVSLNQLKELGDRLVLIHSQNSILTLNNVDFQLAVIDGFAGNLSLAAEYRNQYISFLENGKKLEELVEREEKAKADQDYVQFLLNELDEAKIEEREQLQLEEQLNLLTHSEEIKTSLYRVSQVFILNESNVIVSLGEIKNLLTRISSYYPVLDGLIQRLESNLIDLKDIQTELEQIDQGIEYNPETLEKISSRLDLIYRLQKKHHVANNAELTAVRENLRAGLKEITSLDSQIKTLQDNIKSQQEELKIKARQLSQKRKSVLPKFEEEIVKMLIHMGMPDAKFKVSHSLIPQFNKDGNDRIIYLFNANRGHELKELSEVASGGELSRLMLSIKSLISQKNLLPTIIFDEIDNGISGDIAGKVGDILVQAAQNMQVIVITHLPQIAGKAAWHFTVYKEVLGNTTYSKIKKLDQDDRVGELAKMLGGTEKSQATLATAKELLRK